MCTYEKKKLGHRAYCIHMELIEYVVTNPPPSPSQRVYVSNSTFARVMKIVKYLARAR